jgi:hypothetical protein
MCPAWAMVQYSTDDSWPERWKNTLIKFMAGSTDAQAMISQPKETKEDDCIMMVSDAQDAEEQLEDAEGNPMVRAWKVGGWKKLDSIFCEVSWDSWFFIFPRWIYLISFYRNTPLLCSRVRRRRLITKIPEGIRSHQMWSVPVY